MSVLCEEYTDSVEKHAANVSVICDGLNLRTSRLDDQLNQFNEKFQDVSTRLDESKREIEHVLQTTRNDVTKLKETISNETEAHLDEINLLHNQQKLNTEKINVNCKMITNIYKDGEERQREFFDKITVTVQNQDSAIRELKRSIDDIKDTKSETKETTVDTIQSTDIKEMHSRLSEQSQKLKHLIKRQTYRDHRLNSIQTEYENAIGSVTGTMKNIEDRQIIQDSLVGDINRRLECKADRDSVEASVMMNSHNIAGVNKNVKEIIEQNVMTMTRDLAIEWKTGLCQFVEKNDDSRKLMSTLNRTNDLPLTTF